MRGILKAEAYEGLALGAHRFDGVRMVSDPPQTRHQTREACFDDGVEQPRLVPKIVIDGGRCVTAAVGEPTHREPLVPAFHENRLGGCQNGAARVIALLLAAALGGRRGGCGGHWDPERCKVFKYMIDDYNNVTET